MDINLSDEMIAILLDACHEAMMRYSDTHYSIKQSLKKVPADAAAKLKHHQDGLTKFESKIEGLHEAISMLNDVKTASTH